MLGGLHIEMAPWSVLGDLLDGSGWTTALSEAEVASCGATHLTEQGRKEMQILNVTFDTIFLLLGWS